MRPVGLVLALTPLLSGCASEAENAAVNAAIYEASAPIPGPALNSRSEQFLREVRLLVHEAVHEGGGELVSDVLGQTPWRLPLPQLPE